MTRNHQLCSLNLLEFGGVDGAGWITLKKRIKKMDMKSGQKNEFIFMVF